GAFGKGEAPHAHRPLEEDERDENDDDHDEDLKAADNERPRALDLTQQRRIISRDGLRGRRTEEAPAAEQRLEDRVHEGREISERQEQREDDFVEGRGEAFPEIAEELLDGWCSERGDEGSDAEREDDRVRRGQPSRPRRARRERELLRRARDRQRDGRRRDEDERERHERRAIHAYG